MCDIVFEPTWTWTPMTLLNVCKTKIRTLRMNLSALFCCVFWFMHIIIHIASTQFTVQCSLTENPYYCMSMFNVHIDSCLRWIFVVYFASFWAAQPNCCVSLPVFFFLAALLTFWFGWISFFMHPVWIVYSTLVHNGIRNHSAIMRFYCCWWCCCYLYCWNPKFVSGRHGTI